MFERGVVNGLMEVLCTKDKQDAAISKSYTPVNVSVLCFVLYALYLSSFPPTSLGLLSELACPFSTDYLSLFVCFALLQSQSLITLQSFFPSARVSKVSCACLFVPGVVLCCCYPLDIPPKPSRV